MSETEVGHQARIFEILVSKFECLLMGVFLIVFLSMAVPVLIIMQLQQKKQKQ